MYQFHARRLKIKPSRGNSFTFNKAIANNYTSFLHIQSHFQFGGTFKLVPATLKKNDNEREICFLVG